MESSSESMENIISNQAKEIVLGLLPDKSKDQYLLRYEKFMAWKRTEQIEEKCFSEDVLLVYFNRLKSKYKPSTLFVEYSMLRTTILRNDNVDINYAKLNTFLKKCSVGFHPKKSNVFRPDELRRFLSEANDIEFLVLKVILVFGVYGATRAEELTKVDVADVREEGQVFIIKIPQTKTNIIRSFTVENEYALVIRKYIQLRPAHTPHSRFFVNYQGGKCTTQPIGRNKFLKAPRVIATFLTLEDAENYTGHSFRRTSATLLADSGADLLTLKRHGGWRSSAVAESYIEESISNKRKIGGMISKQINLKKSRVSSQTIVTSTITSRSEVSGDPDIEVSVDGLVEINDEAVAPSTSNASTVNPSTLNRSTLNPSKLNPNTSNSSVIASRSCGVNDFEPEKLNPNTLNSSVTATRSCGVNDFEPEKLLQGMQFKGNNCSFVFNFNK